MNLSCWFIFVIAKPPLSSALNRPTIYEQCCHFICTLFISHAINICLIDLRSLYIHISILQPPLWPIYLRQPYPTLGIDRFFLLYYLLHSQMISSIFIESNWSSVYNIILNIISRILLYSINQVYTRMQMIFFIMLFFIYYNWILIYFIKLATKCLFFFLGPSQGNF